MMYLLTMGWFLAHTSLPMTPEHSATNGEYSSLRSARAGHSKSMCLSSPKAPGCTGEAGEASKAKARQLTDTSNTSVVQVSPYAHLSGLSCCEGCCITAWQYGHAWLSRQHAYDPIGKDFFDHERAPGTTSIEKPSCCDGMLQRTHVLTERIMASHNTTMETQCWTMLITAS